MSSSIKTVSLPAKMRGTEAWLKVVEAYNLCDKVLVSRLAAVNVPIAEHEVLMTLLRNPGATQQEIAKGCFVAKSGISMTLLRLESLELVRREADTTDARIKRTYLTSKGEKLAQKTFKIQQELVQVMASPLSDSDLKSISLLMEKVSTELRAITTTQ
jgi:DNA-binding MarR family transcriptional regulator